MGIIPARHRPTSRRIRTIQLTLLSLVSIIAYGALFLPLLNSATASLQAGEVSPSNFQAPKDFGYISLVRTAEEQRQAESAVPDMYTNPDPAIARRQIERLRAALQYITLVRDDENSTPEQKKTDIAALSDISLGPETIENILILTPARWDVIQQEALNGLEQVMRRSIRDVEVDTVRRSVPS